MIRKSVLLLAAIFLLNIQNFAQTNCDSLFMNAIHIQQIKQYEVAISKYSAYMQVCTSYMSEAYLNRGFCYYTIGQKKKASEDFKSAFEVSEDKSTTMNGFAGFFLHKEAYDTLFNICKSLVSIDSANSDAYFYMARCKWLARLKILKLNNVDDYATDTALQSHLKDEIMFYYDKAIYLDSIKNWELYTSRPDSIAWSDENSHCDYYVSRAFFEQNFLNDRDAGNALKDFETAMMIHPTIEEYEYAAYVARYLGQNEKACKYIQQWAIMIPFPPNNDLNSNPFKKKEIADKFCKEMASN